MADLTPETLAVWRANWTEAKERGGQDVIITPEFALALLDAIDASEADRLQMARFPDEKALRERAEAALVAVEAVCEQVEADDALALNYTGQHLYGAVVRVAEMIREALADGAR